MLTEREWMFSLYRCHTSIVLLKRETQTCNCVHDKDNNQTTDQRRTFNGSFERLVPL